MMAQKTCPKNKINTCMCLSGLCPGTDVKSFSCGKRVGEGRAFHLRSRRGILTFNMPQVMDQQSKARPSPPPLPFTLLIDLLSQLNHCMSSYWPVLPSHACSNFLVCLQGLETYGIGGKVNVTDVKCDAEPNSPVSPLRDK